MEEEKKSQNSIGRLVSLDVFRGATIAAMILVNDPGSWSYVFAQLRHAVWHGWTFTDLVFPFFLFIVGVAIVFAFSKRILATGSKKDLYKKIIRRTLIIYALGLFLSGFPYFDFSTIRVVGVLNRIAICYLVVSIIYLHSTWKGQLTWAVALLLVYWAMMEWIPVPGVGAGVYEMGKNFSNYIDSILLKGHMWSQTKTWDPEGIVSTLPAISTTLFGVLTGHWLKSEKTPLEKTLGMLMAGNVGLLLGSIWGFYLPINKSIWTSSYSVLMAGLALICLSFCYYFIDVKGKRKWIQPAMVYGTNAIAVYVLAGVVGKLSYIITVQAADGTSQTIKDWIYQNLFASWLGPLYGSLGYAIGFVVLMYLAMLILYTKKIFIKI